jgi:hypothetical protein
MAAPREVDRSALDDPTIQVVTVCDQAHEALAPHDRWWHWSIPDPVASTDANAFDAVVAEIGLRISSLIDHYPPTVADHPRTGASS